MRILTLLIPLIIPFTQVAAAEESPVISPAKRLESGVLLHSVTSPFQAGSTELRVLLPEFIKETEKLPVIYLLPVEAGTEHRWGDALEEIAKLKLKNKQRAIYAAPTFSHLPWYANHPENPRLQQERYLLEIVIPFVESTYPALADAKGRLLLGFSKSGYGAWSLLLRHSETFAKSVAWDAPLMLNKPGPYGSKPIFGDDENFQQYQVSALLKARGKTLGDEKRLILMGYDNFRSHHQQMHALLNELGIPHEYRDGPQREHHWNSGWLKEAVDLLLEQTG